MFGSTLIISRRLRFRHHHHYAYIQSYIQLNFSVPSQPASLAGSKTKSKMRESSGMNGKKIQN